MIGVLTHHWTKPDRITKALQLLDRNGAAQSKHPGYGFRQTMISRTNPTQITTIVTWESNEIYETWRASAARTQAMAGADELWSDPPLSERFDILDEPRISK